MRFSLGAPKRYFQMSGRELSDYSQGRCPLIERANKYLCSSLFYPPEPWTRKICSTGSSLPTHPHLPYLQSFHMWYFIFSMPLGPVPKNTEKDLMLLFSSFIVSFLFIQSTLTDYQYVPRILPGTGERMEEKDKRIKGTLPIFMRRQFSK